ncbi:pyrimidine-nucleoside phosphorylase [Pseudogracilibacillus auburnensis]|uniref:Pyrimidine-nucleoside phosphorylase n=1 Tax=Pseudogracilibacillus auburnensis TaxID=1494959 RepID=A0A2V3W2X6_9BACI|nr:pyrimidine-nucleoside phosphorylase [Pseudogracilibacillus auburnensis]PXW88693.1 pyrimidine-nucleoside phosphorylase [Pseudogracilibacillus auburnensis]
MRMYDVIEKKREGFALTEAEINFLIEGYTKKMIPDYQMSALLMAIYFQGMSTDESAALTMAMVRSGHIVDLSSIKGIKVDKHSSGGVGDTTTIILAPLVASLGVSVAKMSGRGLGHTGGTLDKLEAINGFHVELSTEKFVELVNKNHLAVIGQSENLAPADKLLYSLRDVTATVNSIPLISSSIMSKKIASGADAIVLDVKTGAGAFMKTKEEAKNLAETMVAIGNTVGKKTVAILSSMEQPLGNAIGNALEVQEAINTLKGQGPKDLTELSLELASHMVVLAKKANTIKEAKERLHENLHNGKAIEKFQAFIKAQGGDDRVIHDPSKLPQAKYIIPIYAEKSGYISKLVADEIGKAAMMLGAGRQTKESVIDLAVGIILHKKLGEYVQKGDSLYTIYANTPSIDLVKKKMKQSIEVSNVQMADQLIIETIE